MFGGENDDDYVGCPYDKSHRVLRKRLQNHILRCKVNHPEVELQKCPFNVLHLVPEAEYVNHVTMCPDRKIVTQYQCQHVDGDKIQEKHNPIDGEENWDE